MGARAPFKVGDRVAVMKDGYSLVLAIVLTVEQTASSTWRGDVKTQSGVLPFRRLGTDNVLKASQMEPDSRERFTPVWQTLEASA